MRPSDHFQLGATDETVVDGKHIWHEPHRPRYVYEFLCIQNVQMNELTKYECNYQ